ncbi:MAG: CoB--CoM heterodisulfide reductase iron-sulfur subunit A family protein, partial [Thermodesulfobacteriota bacterium]
VYVCGTSQGPKDIPTSVAEASAAANFASCELAPARNTATKETQLPPEIDISGQETRIGVFVCNCGANIGGVVNVDEVVRFCENLPNVAFVTQNLFTCSEDAQAGMKDAILEHGLNRIVVASCTPKTHESIFMETLESCGLNKYLFEMANIRNQDSWVHSDHPDQATQKAKDLVRMAVARAANLYPLIEKKIPVNPRAMVIGGGISGMNAALGIAKQGFEVYLIEKEAELGGLSSGLTTTIEGHDVRDYVEDLKTQVAQDPNIQVLTNSLIVGFSGVKGNFTTELLIGPGMYERKIEHGAIVLATGANEYTPTEYLYGQDDRVLTQTELADYLEKNATKGLQDVVMIQCIGSRNEDNPNCSRVCCQAAIKNALYIKELSPETNVYILYRDIRTYGKLEEYYTLARQKGVLFLRFSPEKPPEIESTPEGLNISLQEQIINRPIEINADLLCLSAGMVPEDTAELSSILKLQKNADGYFLEAHVKLRPMDMVTEGVFVCGTAHSPMLISEAATQARAAASRVSTFLAQSNLTLSAVTARVDPEKCAACLVCVRACPFGVPRINQDGVSEIDEALCQGCGVCAAECPAKAIELNWYEDKQITCEIDALLEGALG